MSLFYWTLGLLTTTFVRRIYVDFVPVEIRKILEVLKIHERIRKQIYDLLRVSQVSVLYRRDRMKSMGFITFYTNNIIFYLFDDSMMMTKLPKTALLSILPLNFLSLTSQGLTPSAKSTRNSRRDFLESSLTSLTTASIAAASTQLAVPTLPTNAEDTAAAASAIATTTSSLIPQNTPLSLPKIGLGAWAWGDSLFWGYDKKNDEELRQVFDFAVKKDLAFFDTAELYGLGRSEELLGKFREEDCKEKDEREKVVIASKFAALPWRTKREDVVKACKASVKRLG